MVHGWCIALVLCDYYQIKFLKSTKVDGTDGTSQLEENRIVWRFVIWQSTWLDLQVPLWSCTNGITMWLIPCQLLPLWLLRPWLHCFSLQSHITKADREKHSWSSDGNTKVQKAHGKVVCVYLVSKQQGYTGMLIQCLYPHVFLPVYNVLMIVAIDWLDQVGWTKASRHADVPSGFLQQGCWISQKMVHWILKAKCQANKKRTPHFET